MAIRFLGNYLNEQLEAILKHKWILSERANGDVGLGATLIDLEQQSFFKKFRDDYFKNNNITVLDSQVKEILDGNSCLVFNFELIVHNYKTNKESVLEKESLKYCLVDKENCEYRSEISDGLYVCNRDF